MDDDKTKCVICWQVLGSKKLLLHGMKCQRFKIYEKLKLIVHPLDFKTLYNENVFPEPRICNLCFVTVKQIPQGIKTLQDLLGTPINLKLSEGTRDWDANIDVNEAGNTSHGGSSASSFQSPCLGAAINIRNKSSCLPAEGQKVMKRTKNVQKLRPSTNKKRPAHTRRKSKEQINTNIQGISPTSDIIQINNEESKQSQSRPQHVVKEVMDSSEGCLVKDTHHVKSNNSQECTSVRLATAEMTNSSSDVSLLLASPAMFNPRPRITDFSCSLLENEASIDKNSNVDFNTASTKKHKREQQSQNQGALVNSCPVTMNNSLIRLRSTQRQSWDSSMECEMSSSNHERLKCKASGRHMEKSISELNNIHDVIVNSVSSLKRKLETLPKKSPASIVKQNKGSDLAINLTKSKKAKIKTDKKMQTSQSIAMKSKHEQMRDITNDIIREERDITNDIVSEESAALGTEIPTQLSKRSHQKLQQLAEKMHESLHGSQLTHICGYPNCGRGFKLRGSLLVHNRTHTGERPYSCGIDDCRKSFKHYSDLTMRQRRHTAEKPHTCDQDGYRKAFTTSTELNEHRNTHNKHATLCCEQCGKQHRNTHNKHATLCCEQCGKQFASKGGLNSHQRKMHGTGKPGRYKCTSEGCTCTFMRKEKYELHLCTHSSACVLFCEKCGKQFRCQRYLDVHYKVHEKNFRNSLHPPERTVVCEVSGCKKKFTSRVYMKRHIISYHMGRRPRPEPGVLFACSVESCDKKFSLKSTLSRHNLLVHKGGDYKLNRTVVKYPCTYSGCNKVLNRKNLLEEHMVTEHGKVPQKLLTQQMRELNCGEKICATCGMVLAFSQLTHHENIYHGADSYLEMKERSSYACQLEDCGVECRTQAERLAHVQKHIESPPYKCKVGDCQETFYVLKNLNNHLWNHSKKPSACDVDGCSQIFDDQFQLAKHSKLHYDGRMKCPWKNCGSWFTAVGTLKQHFLAHSRSLIASFGWDFVCNQCDRVFSSKYGLKNHMKAHEDSFSENLAGFKTTEFVCEEPGCKAEFSQHREFFDHFLHHYTNTPAACGFDGCTETLPTMLLKSKHGKSHYGGKYMCPWQNCGKMFASSFFQVKKHLYRHLLSIPSVAADRSRSCPQCDLVFRFENNLINHTSQHSEKSDYVCTVCGKKFHYNHLKRHMLTHRQEKPHACSHCGVRYGTVNGLKFHVLQKHKIGKWPFKCSYCGKGFISSTELRRHLPSHTKEKPFSCGLCGDTFATHTGYKGHMRKHAGQKYVCDVEGCGKVYTTALSMRGHKAEHAGFSKMCSYCGKTYKNPYGHKCKASREARQKGSVQGPKKPNSVVIPSASTVSVPAPASVSREQCAVLITPTVATLSAEIQLTDRNALVPNSNQTHYLTTPSMSNSLTLRLPADMPQGFIQTLPSHDMVQDRSQPLALDIIRGTPISIAGNHTFNNCVVFWDSQNMLEVLKPM